MRNVHALPVRFKRTKQEPSTQDLLDYLEILVRKAGGNATKTARASIQRVFDKIVERL